MKTESQAALVPWRKAGTDKECKIGRLCGPGEQARQAGGEPPALSAGLAAWQREGSEESLACTALRSMRGCSH